MSCTAIICEYNPFHRGHAYHIARTRAAFPDSPVVCVMSGQFVQRGEPAILSKRARAEAALCAGASLVVELPAAYALAGAQAFADGGAAAAAALGAERLSFGSESGDAEGLLSGWITPTGSAAVSGCASAVSCGVPLPCR